MWLWYLGDPVQLCARLDQREGVAEGAPDLSKQTIFGSAIFTIQFSAIFTIQYSAIFSFSTCLSRSTTPSPMCVNSPGAFSPHRTWSKKVGNERNNERNANVHLGSDPVQEKMKIPMQMQIVNLHLGSDPGQDKCKWKILTLGLILARTKAEESSIHWFALLSDPRF